MGESLLVLLRDQIDLTRVPFSDRGSRLLVFQHPGECCLYIRLAERLIRVEPGLDAYLRRPPFISKLWLVDGSGSPLDFEIASSAEMIEFASALGRFQLVFEDLDTLVLGLPPRESCGIRLQAHMELRVQGGAPKHVRGLHCSTNGRILRDVTSGQPDDRTIELIVAGGAEAWIALQISDSETVPQAARRFSDIRRKAVERWQGWFDAVPPVSERYRKKYAYAWWVIANNLVSPRGFMGYEAMMPSKAFYLGAWLWDSALHAIALRHAQPGLARDQLRLMLARQLPDGMLPDAVFDEGVVTEIDHPIHARVTKPPILAWAALKLYETGQDADFLGEVYPALCRCNDWWLAQDDDGDGIIQYTHPYSSGLDNSPLWDYGMPVESPDINTYLAIQMECLAEIAEILDRPDEAGRWRVRARALEQRIIEALWDEQAGLFRALHQEEPIPVVTPFNLLPLWTGRLPAELARRLVAHLRDPQEFGGERMLPTVARNDPAYDPDDMWRGPIWANINYFFIEALRCAGETALADELREKTLNLIMSQPGIHEYYHPETGRPPRKAAPMFGWTAAVFIELALQASRETAGGSNGAGPRP